MLLNKAIMLKGKSKTNIDPKLVTQNSNNHEESRAFVYPNIDLYKNDGEALKVLW